MLAPKLWIVSSIELHTSNLTLALLSVRIQKVWSSALLSLWLSSRLAKPDTFY